MGKLRLLKTGHGDVCLAEWDPSKEDTITMAREIFRDELRSGRLAFRLDGPGRSLPIKEFSVDAPEILLVPPIQGGASLDASLAGLE